jgi:hypothetical protein
LKDQLKNAEIIQRQVNNRVTNRSDGLDQKIRQFQQDARDFKANNDETDRQMTAMREAVDRIKENNLNPAEQALNQAVKGLDPQANNAGEAPKNAENLPGADPKADNPSAKDQAGAQSKADQAKKQAGAQAKGEQAKNQGGEQSKAEEPQQGDQKPGGEPQSKGDAGAPSQSKGSASKSQQSKSQSSKGQASKGAEAAKDQAGAEAGQDQPGQEADASKESG